MYSPTRATIPTGGVAYDGQILPYATYTSVKAAMTSGSLPVVTNAQWLADPKLRQAFAEVDADHFRCPDYNGVQAGSIAQLALTGGTTAQAGIFHGEAPNAKGTIGASGTGVLLIQRQPAAYSRPRIPIQTALRREALQLLPHHR
jgi:hypothetical protein